MLGPVVDGAGIIYVVDGSCPFGADYEPEMEILRWTSSLSLALINNIHNDDYVQEWQDGLSQYFRTVRVFDAHHDEFAKQLELLEPFGHLDPDWRDVVDKAAGGIGNVDKRRGRRCPGALRRGEVLGRGRPAQDTRHSHRWFEDLLRPQSQPQLPVRASRPRAGTPPSPGTPNPCAQGNPRVQ